jgi:hypothetical protein
MAILGTVGIGRSEDQVVERTLTSKDLYSGLEATRVLPKDTSLVLDVRNWPKNGAAGIITTDIIDLGDDGILGKAAAVTDLRIALTTKCEAPASVTTEIRTGTTFFQDAGTWTAWQLYEGAFAPRGHYAQIRLKLSTTDIKVLPAVNAVRLTYSLKAPVFQGSVTLVEDRVQKIVNSVVVFGYERPDQPDLLWLNKTFKLEGVIAGKKTEFEKLRALLDWVAARKNKRPGPTNSDGSYPWNLREVFTEENGGTMRGHCMSYCETFIAVAVSLGWQARHFAIQGFRDTSHEVPEVWVNELAKWVYMDPSLDTYYTDRKTNEPLNLLQMHNAYVNFVLKPGEILRRGEEVNLDRVESLRGKHPVKCITNDYTYGQREKWDWEFGHGYLTAGWMQLTPRNNWQSQPQPWCKDFSDSPDGYCGFPVYVDSRTPIVEPTTSLWYTRERDFWWTLNQASFRMIRSQDNTVEVECGTSQPFFHKYLARIDDSDWRPVDVQFTWTLKAGNNRIEITCEDEFGKRASASLAIVRYDPNDSSHGAIDATAFSALVRPRSTGWAPGGASRPECAAGSGSSRDH